MKVYAAPEEVARPVHDFANFDRHKYFAQEEDYLKRLKEHLKSMGYTGEHTGEEFSIPCGDGAARYMVMEGPKTFALVHLPLGDAWSVPEYMTRGLRKGDVLKKIESTKRIAELFRQRDAAAQQAPAEQQAEDEQEAAQGMSL